MTNPEELRGQLLIAIRGAWSTRPTCWDRQVDAVVAIRDEERDVLATQVAAVRTLITEDYGTDYDDEDVPAAVERLMRHLSKHEANVQRIAQSKNEALERAQAERDALKAELAEARAERDALRARLTGVAIHANRLKTRIAPGTESWAVFAELSAALDAPHRPKDARRSELEQLQDGVKAVHGRMEDALRLTAQRIGEALRGEESPEDARTAVSAEGDGS